MSDHETALFLPLRPKWLGLILSGQKDVELRRVMPRQLQRGMTVVLYETGKNGAVRGMAKAQNVIRSVSSIRDHWSPRTGMENSREVEDYLTGAKSPGAIVLEDVCEILPVPRASLYRMWPGFKVPQSFRYVPAAWVDRVWSRALLARAQGDKGRC